MGFSEVFGSKRMFWLLALLVSVEFDSEPCYSSQGLTSRSVSQGGVRLRPVLVRAESLISWISPRKRIFRQNHFSLFIGGPGGFHSWRKKMQQKISWHCHFKCVMRPVDSHNGWLKDSGPVSSDSFVHFINATLRYFSALGKRPHPLPQFSL